MALLLTKDAILSADDLPTEDVEVPEWGGTVRVRGLTGTERDRFEFQMAAARKDNKQIDIRAAYAGRCMVGEDGKRLFQDKELPALGKKSGAVLDRVFDVVRKLSGMTDEKLKKAAEDFDNAPTEDDSPSD